MKSASINLVGGNSVAKSIPNTHAGIDPSSKTISDTISIIKQQASAIYDLADKIDENFHKAMSMILETSGRVIVSGMGKSGLIGQKIVATFASTGTPSLFMHPAEAYHGDLGMITPNDIVILISYSGETDEVIRLIPSLQHFGVSIISIVGNTKSTMARHSAAVLDISVEREVCPNNLAPTTSTLTTLAIGDALAVALIKARNFQPHDFARYHPGGSLGRRLLTRVRNVMRCDNLPIVSPSATFNDVVLEITKGRMGLVLVMHGSILKGIVTDGDLRRAMVKEGAGCMDLCAEQLMSPDPVSIIDEAMQVEAEELMRQRKIKALVALDNDGNVSGILEIFS